MAKISKFEKANLAKLRTELDNAIFAVCEKHGIKSDGLGNIRFTDNTFRVSRLEFSVIHDTVTSSLKECGGIKVGDRFKSNRRLFTITDIVEDVKFGICTFYAVTQNGVKYKLKESQISIMERI